MLASILARVLARILASVRALSKCMRERYWVLAYIRPLLVAAHDNNKINCT